MFGLFKKKNSKNKKSKASQEEWPFPYSPNTVSFCSLHILDEGAPVVEIHHDEDGDFSFLCSQDFGEDFSMMRVVSLASSLAAVKNYDLIFSIPEGKRAKLTETGEWVLSDVPKE